MMSWLNLWKSVSQATRKAALLCFSAVLVTALGLVAAPPAHADGCAYVTGGQLVFCDVYPAGNSVQQVTAHVGDRVCLCLRVRLSDGATPDVSGGPGTTYFSGGSPGLEGNFPTVGCFIPSRADANKQFPLYAIYHDPCKNVNWTFTVSLHVIP